MRKKQRRSPEENQKLTLSEIQIRYCQSISFQDCHFEDMVSGNDQSVSNGILHSEVKLFLQRCLLQGRTGSIQLEYLEVNQDFKCFISGVLNFLPKISNTRDIFKARIGCSDFSPALTLD